VGERAGERRGRVERRGESERGRRGDSPVSFQGMSSNTTPDHSCIIASSCFSREYSRLAASLISCRGQSVDERCGKERTGEGEGGRRRVGRHY
jgi:hypothetical protein